MTGPIQTPLQAGSNGIIVGTECRLSNGLPGMTIVGLGNKAIDEARERVRNAFGSSQIAMPRKRITINLAPADVPKESTSLDLAIALAILQADGQTKKVPGKDSCFIGELGLDGGVRPVRGIIGKLLIGQRYGISRFFIPAGNMDQAQLVPDIVLLPVASLNELFLGLNSAREMKEVNTKDGYALPENTHTNETLLADVMGQHQAKRGLEIAAAGGHNIFLNGPPGTGKSMLARALSSILPPLHRQEMLEITQLHSLVSGSYNELVTSRPFRAPHHSASHVAVVGGGNNLRPGEISLAHRGVLLFDEFPEFGRSTIEALRQPLEDRTITVVRAKESATFPANFILVATANPCPCGYYGTAKPCNCSAHTILQYRQKLSGPIMDRIDLYTEVQEIEHELLLATPENSTDKLVRDRVIKARTQQSIRYDSQTKLLDKLDPKNPATWKAIGTARINEVVQKRLGDVVSSDYVGHEGFISQETMLKAYREYYGPQVDLDTPVKIIRFTFNNNQDSETNVVVEMPAKLTEVKMYADGGSRGNPGPSASGFAVLDMDDKVVVKKGVYLGVTTNNQAEYLALKLGLEEALRMQAKEVHVYMDSLLVVNQMLGIFKVRNRDLWPIHAAIKDLVTQFGRVSFQHVPRELNKIADSAVNEALDEALKS